MNETSPETKERYVARYGSSNSRTSSVTASELIGSKPPAISRVPVTVAVNTQISSSSSVSITAVVYIVWAMGCLERRVVLARSIQSELIAGISSSVAGVRTLLKKLAASATLRGRRSGCEQQGVAGFGEERARQ